MSGRRPACPPHSSSAKSDFPVTKLPFRSSTSSALAWFGRIGGEVCDHVEVDETWVGGGTRGKGRGVHDKLLVAGAVEVRVRKPGTKLDERKGRRYAGRVRLAVVPDRSAESLAMSPLPLTPSLTRAIGSTLNVVIVGDNRIGMVCSYTLAQNVLLQRHLRQFDARMFRGKIVSQTLHADHVAIQDD